MHVAATRGGVSFSSSRPLLGASRARRRYRRTVLVCWGYWRKQFRGGGRPLAPCGRLVGRLPEQTAQESDARAVQATLCSDPGDVPVKECPRNSTERMKFLAHNLLGLCQAESSGLIEANMSPVQPGLCSITGSAGCVCVSGSTFALMNLCIIIMHVPFGAFNQVQPSLTVGIDIQCLHCPGEAWLRIMNPLNMITRSVQHSKPPESD